MDILLVNKTHTIPSDYTPQLVDIAGFPTMLTDISCAEPLYRMLTDCKQAGFQPVVISAWRSHSMQQEILQNAIQDGLDNGMPLSEAEADARRRVAKPGTSEHETGLAFDIVDIIDINNPIEVQEESPAQKWLIQHCWEYGFILRYPRNKSEVTGYQYEPWHYRYIGEDHSMALKSNGMSLEEYIESLVRTI